MNRSGYLVIVPPAYTGIALLFCWTYLVFYATSAGIEAAAPVSLYSMGYTASATSMVVTLLVISFARIDRTALLTSKAMKVLAGIALPLSTVGLVVAGQATHTVLAMGSGVVSGVLSGVMLMQWIVAYRRIGLRAAVASFPMLMALSVGLCATLMYLPRTVIVIVTILLPAISELMFHEVRKNPWPQFEDEKSDVPDRPRNFMLMMLPFAIYALASGFLDYPSSNGSYTFAFYAFGAFVPIVVSGVYLGMVERDHFVGTFLIPLSVLVAVCIPFLALRSFEPFSPFISIGELGIEVLIFIVPVAFAEFFSIDSLKTYALGRTAYVLFNGVGWCVAQFAYGLYGQFFFSQMSLVFIFVGVEVLVICLIVASVKANRIAPEDDGADDARAGKPTVDAMHSGLWGDVHIKGDGCESNVDAECGDRARSIQGVQETCAAQGVPYRPSPQESQANGQSAALAGGADVEAIADSICREYGLSRREHDVFALLARGYTSTRIQKELHIAAGTVNYHSRNIYAKLGVHSKQELIALFEEAQRR